MFLFVFVPPYQRMLHQYQLSAISAYNNRRLGPKQDTGRRRTTGLVMHE